MGNDIQGPAGSGEYLVVQVLTLSLIYVLPGSFLVLMTNAPNWTSMLTTTGLSMLLLFLEASALGLPHVDIACHRRFATTVLPETCQSQMNPPALQAHFGKINDQKSTEDCAYR